MGFHEDFNFLCEHVFDTCGVKYSQPQMEPESAEYHAGRFILQSQSAHYRQAKITPTKAGQFVTLWKRSAQGPIQPYDSTDKLDLFVVSVKTRNHFGLFVFPKQELIQQGVLSANRKGGKRALRVYPPWDKTKSTQAHKTQAWQLKFFAEVPKAAPLDIQKFRSLCQCGPSENKN